MIPENLTENIAFLTGKVTHLFYLKITKAFREKGYDITVEQFSVLTILYYEEGLSQQEIASRLSRDKTTLTRVLSNMEKKNLVVRIEDKMDRRIKNIYLTNLGKELQGELVETSGSIYLNSIKDLTDKDITQLIILLNTMINNLK